MDFSWKAIIVFLLCATMGNGLLYLALFSGNTLDGISFQLSIKMSAYGSNATDPGRQNSSIANDTSAIRQRNEKVYIAREAETPKVKNTEALNTVNVDGKFTERPLAGIPPSISSTLRHSTDRLVYNRLPKCGSTTATMIMRRLSVRNNFTLINSEVYDRPEMDSKEQVRNITHYCQSARIYIYIRYCVRWV